jgi:hypothetical protein
MAASVGHIPCCVSDVDVYWSETCALEAECVQTSIGGLPASLSPRSQTVVVMQSLAWGPKA